MAQFTARPTVYRGVKMRSRTEARYAAALDELGVLWEYEPCCFADGREQYLPDFRVHTPALNQWAYIEVRPNPPSDLRILLGWFDQMRAILASEPGALLCVAFPDWGPWFLVDAPDDPERPTERRGEPDIGHWVSVRSARRTFTAPSPIWSIHFESWESDARRFGRVRADAPILKHIRERFAERFRESCSGSSVEFLDVEWRYGA